MISNTKWVVTSDHTWALWADVCDAYGYTKRRILFVIAYVGRKHVAFGGGPMRWQVSDLRPYQVRLPATEFNDLEAAKAWATAIARLEVA